MTSYRPKITSIIVTYNPNLVLFEKALISHLNNDIKELVIVDNGSRNANEIVSMLDKLVSTNTYLDKNHKCFLLDNNKGIAYAQNVGIKYSKKIKSSHIILFDQDSFLPANLVKTLYEEESELLKKGEKIAAIGPVYRDTNTNKYYKLPLYKGLLVKKISPQNLEKNTFKVSIIIASGTLIRIKVLDHVGLMKEDFFIDLVDIEWCLRVSDMGYNIYATKSVEMYHTIGDSRIVSLGREISIHSPLRKYYSYRNKILLIRQKGISMTYKIRTLLSLFKLPFQLYDVSFKKEYVKMIFTGIGHGIMNYSGKF